MPKLLPALITTAQLAQLLDLDERTIQRRAAKGYLAAQKLPGRTGAWVFSRETVEQLLRGEERLEEAS